MWKAVGLLAAIVLLIVLVPIVDIMTLGPYTTWYNERCFAIAQQHELVGKDEAAVFAVLGRPTFIDRGWDKRCSATGQPTADARWWVTYNYAPCPWFPFAKFQVHLSEGVVDNLEKYDD